MEIFYCCRRGRDKIATKFIVTLDNQHIISREKQIANAFPLPFYNIRRAFIKSEIDATTTIATTNTMREQMEQEVDMPLGL